MFSLPNKHPEADRAVAALSLECVPIRGILGIVSSDELRSAALALPRPERAKLIHDLIRSLDESTDDDVEAVWATEIARRAREVADGTVEPVDWEDARERIARRLKERRGQS